jgi:hypothetical protein
MELLRGVSAANNFVLALVPHSSSRLFSSTTAHVAAAGGAQVISSDAIGQASYAEMVQFSGSVRGRIGYAPGHWLVYATGGFAWTYNQHARRRSKRAAEVSLPAAMARGASCALSANLGVRVAVKFGVKAADRFDLGG